MRSSKLNQGVPTKTGQSPNHTSGGVRCGVRRWQFATEFTAGVTFTEFETTPREQADAAKLHRVRERSNAAVRADAYRASAFSTREGIRLYCKWKLSCGNHGKTFCRRQNAE
jgi:hypothetical protein